MKGRRAVILKLENFPTNIIRALNEQYRAPAFSQFLRFLKYFVRFLHVNSVVLVLFYLNFQRVRNFKVEFKQFLVVKCVYLNSDIIYERFRQTDSP